MVEAAVPANIDKVAELADGAAPHVASASGATSSRYAAAGKLTDWNDQEQAAAEAMLLGCCGSRRWARTLTERRPFGDEATLVHAANNLWFLLDEADWLEAFACHPRIGESGNGEHRAAGPGSHAFHAASALEQAAAKATLDSVAERLDEGNRLYEQQNGFGYIVFAEGRTAPELLAILEARLQHDRCTELHEASRQQHCITRLRMQRWLAAG